MKQSILLLLALLLSPPLSLAADAPTTPNEAEMGFSHDALNKGYANWDSSYLDGSHQFGERHSIYGELREARRYNLTDREISGGYYHPLADTWTALLGASVSPDHHVLPKDSLLVQLQKALDGGWDVQAGLRRSLYNPSATAIATDIMALTGERYWGNYRAAYTLYLGKLQGSGTAPSHALQLSYYYADHSYCTLGGAKGRQAESLGSGLGVLLTEVSSTSLSGRHWLNPGWGLSYEAIVEHQGNLYTRKGIRLGLRHAF